MKNQSGFALIWLVFWIPIALLAISCVFYLKAWLTPQERNLQICRSMLLKNLSPISSELKKFIELNVEVFSLRELRANAEMALKIAIASNQEEAAVIAEIELQSVIAQQEALRAQQNLAKQKLTLDLRSLQRLIEEKIATEQRRWTLQTQENFDYRGHIKFSSPVRLAVRAMTAPDLGPPTYVLMENFSQVQALHISWNEQIHSKLKGESIWKLSPLYQPNGCTGSLKQTLVGFQPILLADKFSLSSCSWCP